MLRMRWLNLVLAGLLMMVPLQGVFAQIGPLTHPAEAHAGKGGAQDAHPTHHTGHQHPVAADGQEEQQTDQPCDQHKGPCLACDLCGAHCSASLMRCEFSAVIIHFTVVVAPPSLTAMLILPPPGEPPQFLLS